MIRLKKKKQYNIDIKTADKMLQNVFAACDATPNRVPFDKIVLRNKQNLFTDNLFIVISSVIFILSFITPLFFPHSPILVSVDPSMGRSLTVIEHELTADSFSISFEGQSINVSESYMVGSDNTIVLPSEYDRSTNTLVFPYSPQEYNIYVYDIKGKCIHLLLSPHDN